MAEKNPTRSDAVEATPESLNETDQTYEERARRMQALARERGDVAASAESESKHKAEIIQFPLWPEPERAVPNAFLRSALFGVVKGNKRRYCKQEKLAAWPGVELAYTGQQLNQFDEDVWMQLVHLHRVQGAEPGKPLYLNAKSRGFMRELGKGRGANSVKAFYESVGRMEACAVHLTMPVNGKQVEYMASLVQEAARVKGEERWAIILNPRLLPLFAPGHYSRIDWEARRSLPSGLATWLHCYVTSHLATPKKPHRIAVARLYELSGAETEMKDFRRKLKQAMSKLEESGVVFSWSILPSDSLEFVRGPKPKSATK